MKIGYIRKLKSKHEDIVDYTLPLSDDSLHLNPLIGKPVKLTHTGNKQCIASGKSIKKTYAQGYSWESFITLPQCDQCIVKPELCHFSKGTCRDESWGEANCMQAHIIYLSVTSDMKIGITRKTQVPTRWIDQGAVMALPILEVKNRLTSGVIEVEIAKTMSDKTNWRNMLKNKYPEVDLLKAKEEILKKHADLIKKHDAKILDEDIYTFNFPVEKYPEKVSSFNFDKNPTVEGVLMGVKGQYLIFDKGVINMRKFQGYEIEVDF